mgnify:CR=1 FL=1
MLMPTLLCWAQEAAAERPEMADVMRSNGKIYVVVAIVVMIFLGIIFYLLRIERKVKDLEDRWINKG